jgi:hypothetical protein
MSTLTRWLLRAFADEWPGGLPQSGDTGGPLYLVDREDSVVVDPDTSTDPTTLTEQVPSNDFDLNVGNVLGVALVANSDTPAGLGGREYLSEPSLSVRIEAVKEREHGHVADADEFRALWKTAVETVGKIDNGTLKAAPLSNVHVTEPQDQSPDLDSAKNYYRYDFEAEVRGYRQI